MIIFESAVCFPLLIIGGKILDCKVDPLLWGQHLNRMAKNRCWRIQVRAVQYINIVFIRWNTNKSLEILSTVILTMTIFCNVYYMWCLWVIRTSFKLLKFAFLLKPFVFVVLRYMLRPRNRCFYALYRCIYAPMHCISCNPTGVWVSKHVKKYFLSVLAQWPARLGKVVHEIVGALLIP